ncbi:membrane protein [Rhizobium rhizogenes]|nr:membrane protein [Rhizobium rhizogenes]
MHRSRGLVLLRKHQVILVAIAIGVAVFLLLTSRTVNAGNMLIAWNATAIIYIVFSLYRMLTADARLIRKRSADLDFSDALLLFLSIAAAVASIGGIALDLLGIKDAPPDVAFFRVAMAIVTILISWAFLHILFTIHYAHRFYGGSGKGEGLVFAVPVDEPIYWDFLYFSFTIGVASQTADIGVSSVSMRKLVLLHSILSFLFNTTILALAINVGASLV